MARCGEAASTMFWMGAELDVVLMTASLEVGRTVAEEEGRFRDFSWEMCDCGGYSREEEFCFIRGESWTWMVKSR